MTDEDVLVVKIKADDPRGFPTQVISLIAPAGDMSMSQLDGILVVMEKQYGWGMGYEFEVRRRGGGIGAEGASVLELVLGVVTTVPTVLDLFERFTKRRPTRASRATAAEQATWAVARAYSHVARRSLHRVAESDGVDHWTFQFMLPDTDDRFEVEVYGSADTALATRVSWMNGDAWGNRAPGQPPGPTGTRSV